MDKKEQGQVANDLRTTGYDARQKSNDASSEKIEEYKKTIAELEEELKKAKAEKNQVRMDKIFGSLKIVGEKLEQLYARARGVFLKNEEAVLNQSEQFDFLKIADETYKKLCENQETYAEVPVKDATILVFIGEDKKPVYIVDYPAKNQSGEELDIHGKHMVVYTYGETSLAQHDLTMDTFYTSHKIISDSTNHRCNSVVSVLGKDGFLKTGEKSYSDSFFDFEKKGDLVKLGESGAEGESRSDIAFMVPKEISSKIEAVMKAKRAYMQLNKDSSETEPVAE